ncbi:MAG: carboxypeptidase-like regulatory domain-containing protein [Myxococcales bacterium]|nr:carboxypeptidase-like regulatory domain-containing protein [Myxococcota bacterium]MDW8284165.1 carboxypeptidase-like regulatory domain-containing protein [Myxococcales bacterium]
MSKAPTMSLTAYGDSVPTRADTLVPVTQKQLLRSDIAAGIWMMHVVSVDRRNCPAREAGHLRVSLGEDPGSGAVPGQVVDRTGQGVEGATVILSCGLYAQVINSTGHYNLGAVPAGAWELRASKMGSMPIGRTNDVTQGSVITTFAFL